MSQARRVGPAAPRQRRVCASRCGNRNYLCGGRHQSEVYTVRFGRDVRTLVSGGRDGACYLWDLQPPGDRPDNDPAQIWDDLAGEDSSAAFQAIRARS